MDLPAVLEKITPEGALLVYQPLIDGTPQAVPILTAFFGEGEPEIYEVDIDEEFGPRNALTDCFLLLTAQKRQPDAVLFQGEAWHRMFDLENGDETLGQAVSMFYADCSGKQWAAAKQFTRAVDGTVTWLPDTFQVDPDPMGSTPLYLGLLVGLMPPDAEVTFPRARCEECEGLLGHRARCSQYGGTNA